MPIIDDIVGRIEELKRTAEKPVNAVDPVPKKGSEELDQFVQDLWEDSELYEQTYYQETKHLRRSKPDEKGSGVGFDRESWDKAAEALAYGENWEYVWGHRPEDWMKERVDGEIPRKVSVRKDTITAKYHDFTISPNIKDVTSIYDQERERMGAQDWLEEYVQMALTYGRAVNEITVDYNLHPQGQVKNIARRYVGRTPGARSFLSSDGCNYVIFPDVVTAKQIETDFPDVDANELNPIGEDVKSKTRANQAKRQDYKHTKFYQKYRVYIDDPSLEKIPFDKDAESELIDEQKALLDGISVKARPEQNHMRHLAEKVEAYLRFTSIPPRTQGEIELREPTEKAYLENLLEHLDFVDKNKIESLGYRQKYPNGRYLCWIGGKVVKDEVNPLNVAWRKLVREIRNRSIQGRSDGAGDPEVMYRQAYQSDIQLSRIEELTLKGVPKIFRHYADKAQKDITVADDNDPLKTSYFVQQPPQVVKAEAPTGLVELYKMSKENTERDTNINSVARGEEQPSGTPASLVAMIQRQNRFVVAGELDRNLRSAMKDIIEGNLAVMRELYKENRQYVVNGQVQDINVSELLSFVEVAKGGVREKVEVPMFEVTIKPGSNQPDQWETKLALLIDLRSQMTDPVKAMAMDQAIMDHLGIEYPEFAEGGKYRVIEKALQVGMQVLQAQAQEQQAEQGESDRVGKIFQSVQNEAERGMVKEMMGVGGGNGKGKRE